MATHSRILAWEIPRTEEPGGYSPWGHKSQTQLSNQTPPPSLPKNTLAPTPRLERELLKPLAALGLLHPVSSEAGMW